MTSFLNHVFSFKTGSNQYAVSIKPVLADRWVGVCGARQGNSTIAYNNVV